MFAGSRALALKRLTRSVRRLGGPRWIGGHRVLVASVPRCGSTLLVRTLAGLPSGSETPQSKNVKFVRDLRKLPRVKILKTHSLAPPSLPPDVCAIFLFGDPVQAVVSTYRKRYDKNHFRNCGYLLEDPPDILNEDALGYQRLYDSWMKRHTYPLLALRYETMFDYSKVLSLFIGRKVTLPDRKERATRVSPEERTRLEQVYADLIAKVVRSPDVCLWEAAGT